jgi:thiol-disulfide isomerase/thioredoxin
VSARALFAAIALAAVGVGTGLWWVAHSPRERAIPDIAAGALWAASFNDVAGSGRALGEFQGKVVVINFWATWCVPCREEMPAFERLNDRWQARGVQFVGLSDDDPGKVRRFASELGINYPLWVGGENVGDLARRLGNRLGVLPFTVIIDPAGRVLDTKVGPYTEPELDAKLRLSAGKMS